MKFVLYFFLIFFSLCASAQTDVGLIAYYNFDGCNTADTKGFLSTIVGGSPECVCGAVGDALEFDGTNDFLDFQGDYERLFLGDYSISFYFLPKGTSGTHDLLSFRVGCNIDSVFALSYSATDKEFVVELFQNINRNEVMVQQIDDNACWQHIVLVKDEKVLTLYLNGRRVLQEENTQIIGVQNKGTLSLSNSPCVGISHERFSGTIDELRIYNRALPLPEAVELYTEPDNITNIDTTILIGNAVSIVTSESCASSFTWFPTSGVADRNQPDTELSPIVTTQYSLTFEHATCTVTDMIQVTVVDPSNLDCQDIFLPKAFTPNGDGLNEVYGISNPYVFDRLVSFEIFSSWGEKVFATSAGFETWNGEFRGQAVNPGVFVYKLVYICSGEEFSKSGSFSVLR